MDHDHLPKTRKEAIEKNSKFYFSGIACPQGHISARHTGNYSCVECKKLSQYSEKRKEHRRIWGQKNRVRDKKSRMLLVYNMTEEQYQQLLIEQNDCCAICKTPFKHNGTHNERAQIDHCHSTNKVRGLLCGYCNMAIGKLKESVTVVESALNYLKSHSTP